MSLSNWLMRRRTKKSLPPGWDILPYQPDDEAPPDYGDPETSCDGKDDDAS